MKIPARVSEGCKNITDKRLISTSGIGRNEKKEGRSPLFRCLVIQYYLRISRCSVMIVFEVLSFTI